MTTTADRVADLVERGLSAGTSMLDSLSRSPAGAFLQTRLPRAGTCSCEIPPPCWMPRELEARTHVCAGGTATLRLRVTNCSVEASQIEIEATGSEAPRVVVDPPRLSLAALERGVATLKLEVDAKAASRTEHEVLVWVRGCVDHVVRWTVRVAGRGDCCHELDLDDCPDYLHHWYDHFYCARPCH